MPKLSDTADDAISALRMAAAAAMGGKGGSGTRMTITRNAEGNGLVIRVANGPDATEEGKGGDDDGKDETKASSSKKSIMEKDGQTKYKEYNEADVKGWSDMHIACVDGDHERLRSLLHSRDADPNTVDLTGATALHASIIGAGRRSLSRLLTTGISIDKNGVGKPLPQLSQNTTTETNNKSTSGRDGGEEVNEVLDDYLMCIKLILDDERFDLLLHERKDEHQQGGGGHSHNETKKKSQSVSSTKVQSKKNNAADVEDDGFGISPLCLCVERFVGVGDSLLPLLDLLISRGFDTNATECGIGGSSVLHVALRNAHYSCALSLARSGANVNAHLNSSDAKTALRVADAIYGDAFARELREAGVIAMAVADPTRRRDLLRADKGKGGKSVTMLARRAANAGRSFIGASRWREAAGAFMEASSYGPCLPEQERFECLKNTAECFLRVERGQKSEEVARQLVKEFSRVPVAMVALGEAISHPSCGKLTPRHLKEIETLADEALKIEKKSDGKEWWMKLDLSAAMRALKLKELVKGRTSEQNPAVKVANTALDEYFTTGGSIEKAAFAIELALKPELNHPNPLPLHGIRGFIYYSWASEILRTNSLWREDLFRKDGLLRSMSPLKNKLSWREAQEKIEIAFDEFEYYRMMNMDGEFPHLMYGVNISKTSFALGKFEEGTKFALGSIKERIKTDLARMDDGPLPKQDDRFEGGSTQKLILQLNWALDMYRMLVTQMVVDYAINADSANCTLPSCIALEPVVQNLQTRDDVMNTAQLRVLLEKAESVRLLDKPSIKNLLIKISCNPVKVNAAIRGLVGAMKILDTGYQAMTDLRVEVGKVIMTFVVGAHRMQKQTKSSSRVVGSLLMEALEWDKKVIIPTELPKMYLKMAQEFTG